MTPFMLVSRDSEYVARFSELFGGRLRVISGEWITRGAEEALGRDPAAHPKIALLGPLLDFEETRGFVAALRSEQPDVGVIIVRENRGDLEDWIDELRVHAVLSPRASDERSVEVVERLSAWLVKSGSANESDFAARDESAESVTPENDPVGRLFLELSSGGSERSNPLPVTQLHDLDQADPVGAVLRPEGGRVDPSVGVESVPAVDPEEPFEPAALQPGAPTEAIAVVAPKGGQGKTTLALNIAAGLAEVAPNSVVVVDGDLQFGDVSTSLGLGSGPSVVDALQSSDDLDLKATLVHHPDDFFVVASAPTPELADGVSGESLGALVTRLRSIFRFVVVDTTPGLTEHTLGVLENVTDAVLVTNMGVPSLRAMRTELRMLREIRLLPANRHLVVNFADRQSGLTVRDAEAIVGERVDIEIPRSPAVLLASNRGVPLIHDDVRDPAAKAVRALVMRLAPEAFPTRRRIQRRRRTDATQ